MKLKECLQRFSLSRKTYLKPGDYVKGIQLGVRFHKEARVETLYGDMSPEEITRRTQRPHQSTLTPGSWSG